MNSLDRKKCFCSAFIGQLVSRRTFYEHKRSFRISLQQKLCKKLVPISDPFDADISSDNNDRGNTIDNDNRQIFQRTTVPPLKQRRLSESSHRDLEVIYTFIECLIVYFMGEATDSPFIQFHDALLYHVE